MTGPLAEAGVVLPRVTVVTSRWDEWRAAHPETTFMNGRVDNADDYPFDTLLDRDGDGDIMDDLGDLSGLASKFLSR